MTIRTALMTNFVPPYRLKLLGALAARVDELKIFASTKMEADRPWTPDCGDLDVVQQRTLTFERNRLHPSGATQKLFIHFPYDTLLQLWRFAPEVVISGELGLRSLQAALYRKTFKASRLIIWATLSEETERGWGWLRQKLRKFILRTADGVLCNGASGSRYIASFGFPQERIFIVNQPVDTDMFTCLPANREACCARRLVYSGRLISQKAVLQLQGALKQWACANPDRKLEMLWLGDGDLRGQLEASHMPANLVERFEGNQPYEALPGFYGQCGVLVLPSLLDEWGLVVNEAMASGMLVLGSVHSQAVVELVEDGVTGWLIDPRNPETIGAALDLLYDTPLEALALMRRAARQRAMRVTPARAADIIYGAIEHILPRSIKVSGDGVSSQMGSTAPSLDSFQ